MDYREITKKEIEYQKELIKKYEGRLAMLPKGSLMRKEKGGREEYYYMDGGCKQRKYINKSNNKLVEALKTRKYLETALKRMKTNIKAQEILLSSYMNYDEREIKEALPKAYRDVADLLPSKESGCRTAQELRRFGAEPVHTTGSGQQVRSKTEAMIVEILDREKIDFVYEAKLKLRTPEGGEIEIHPDFKFKNRYGDSIYWEHFGMLGMENYRHAALRKIETYICNGIIPSINLLITAEDTGGAMDMRAIYRTVEMLKEILR